MKDFFDYMKFSSVVIFILFASSFSFPFQILPNIGKIGELFWNSILLLEASSLGMSKDQWGYHSGEDSVGLLVNLINLVILGSIISWLAWRMLSSRTKENVLDVFPLLGRYYLALILLIYGFDKIYKWQFYLPESNIMYTRVKDLSQDMLYWTTMGTSYSYSLFAGLMEVIPGIFLLFRRTAWIGAPIAFMVLLNVFISNIGFDITVKVFSGFLTIIALVLSSNFLNVVRQLFMQKQVILISKEPWYSSKVGYKLSKTLLIIVIIIESQFKYFAAQNFNDDAAPRPILNGAYEVLWSANITWQRLHFHRKGYMIIEDVKGDFNDFKLEIESNGLRIVDYHLNEMLLHYTLDHDTLDLYDQNGGLIFQGIKLSSSYENK